MDAPTSDTVAGIKREAATEARAMQIMAEVCTPVVLAVARSILDPALGMRRLPYPDSNEGADAFVIDALATAVASGVHMAARHHDSYHDPETPDEQARATELLRALIGKLQGELDRSGPPRGMLVRGMQVGVSSHTIVDVL